MMMDTMRDEEGNREREREQSVNNGVSGSKECFFLAFSFFPSFLHLFFFFIFSLPSRPPLLVPVTDYFLTVIKKKTSLSAENYKILLSCTPSTVDSTFDSPPASSNLIFHSLHLPRFLLFTFFFKRSPFLFRPFLSSLTTHITIFVSTFQPWN